MSSSYVLVVGIATICATFAGCRDDRPPAARHESDAPYIVETTHLAPVIAIDDLTALGFDTATIYRIEPHFASLNTALVAMGELKKSYDATEDVRRRNELNAYAIPFHLTADRHLRFILSVLKPPQDSLFDRYVAERKRAVGLEDWHPDHRQPTPGLPGLIPSGPARQQ
jgi:hypothetical protein